MEKRKILVSNWKAYIKSTVAVDTIIHELIQSNDFSNLDLIISPPSIYIERIRKGLQGRNIYLASQNFSSLENSTGTNAILAIMIKDLGCEYSILGHSEVRSNYIESGAVVAAQVKLALRHGIIPIVCVGETLESRLQNNYIQFIVDQTTDSLLNIDTLDRAKIIIAYEPIWSIGTSQIPSIGQIEEVFNALRSISGLESSKLLYGGSVDEKNIRQIRQIKHLDGVMLGRAGTKSEKLNLIAEALCRNKTI